MFPLNTSPLNTFDFADQTPIPGFAGPVTSGESQLRVVSLQAAANTGVVASGYLSDTVRGPDIELRFTPTAAPGDGNWDGLMYRISNPGTSTPSYYEMRAWQQAVSPGANYVELVRCVAGTITSIGTQAVVWVQGDQFGVRKLGRVHEIWRLPVGGSWTKIAVLTDNNLTGTGYVGMRLMFSAARVDDLYGGTITPYVKTGFGRLDDNEQRYQVYDKTGFGRLDDGGVRFGGKTGFGSASGGGTGRASMKGVKRGFGSTQPVGGGRMSGRTFIKTGGARIPFAEPPFLEDFYGVRPVGSGTTHGNSQRPPKSGFAVAGAKGSGFRAKIYTKTGFGKSDPNGYGGRTGTAGYSKRAPGIARAVGSGYKVIANGQANQFVKRGAGISRPVGSGYGQFRVVQGKVQVKIGAYDDVAVAGVGLLVDGVPYGDETTTGLQNAIVNPRFEANVASWALVGNPVVNWVTTAPKYGAGCLGCGTTASGQGVAGDMKFSLVGGQSYRAAGWVKGTAGQTVTCDVIVTSTNVRAGNPINVVLNGQWQFVFFDFYAATSQAHRLRVVSASGAQTFYLDAMSLIGHVVFTVDTAGYANGDHYISSGIRDASGRWQQGDTMTMRVANPATLEPKLLVEIAFGSDPRDPVQIWTDVTADFVEGSWGHGRSAVLERMEAGELSLRLRNYTRRYDNVNPSSPFVGKVTVGKRIRTSAIYNEAVYRRFTGSISEWKPVWAAGGKGAYMDISAVDDFTPMARASISTPKASLTTANMTVTSLFGGGNDITVALEDAGQNDAEVVFTETVTEWVRQRSPTDATLVPVDFDVYTPGPAPTLRVVSRNIRVRLKNPTGSAVTSTAQDVVNAINANPNSSQLVAAAVVGTPSTVVAPMTALNLSGGGLTAEITGDRLGWILDRLGIPTTRRQLDTGTTVASAAELDRVAALDYAQAVEATELGQFFFDGDGNAVFHDQDRRTNAALKHTYADMPNAAAQEHLYVDASPSQGNELVYNDIEVSAPDLPTVRAADGASQVSFWPSSYDHSTLLTTEVEMQDRASLLLSRFKIPRDNLKAMLLEPRREADAYKSTTAWPHALALEVSNKLHVRRQPPGGGELLYETFVESIRDSVEAGGTRRWSITVGMSVAFQSGSTASSGGGGGFVGTPWLLEDPTDGLLDQTTRLA